MVGEMEKASIEILGKNYQIHCPVAEINALQRSAQYLEAKMRVMRESGVVNIDKVAIITALNIVHQLMTLEQQKNQQMEILNRRLASLQSKIESALMME
jgi:cell division protein ZapA